MDAKSRVANIGSLPGSNPVRLCHLINGCSRMHCPSDPSSASSCSAGHDPAACSQVPPPYGVIVHDRIATIREANTFADLVKNIHSNGWEAAITMATNRPLPLLMDHDLAANLRILSTYFEALPDLAVKRTVFDGTELAIVYFESLTDYKTINEIILDPIQLPSTPDFALSRLYPYAAKATQDWKTVAADLTRGFAVLFEDGTGTAHLFDVRRFPRRTPDEPSTEAALKGSHIGFIESYQDNLAMIRGYLNDENLACRTFAIGNRVTTTCGLLYLQDVANEDYVNEMAHRISSLDVDAVMNIGILEEWVEDTPYSIFPQFMVTERPDVTVSHLLHGRVAIILDKSAGAVIGPMTFTGYFQALDDYTIRWPVASFLRLLRMVGFLIAVFLPSVYIAAVSFHYEIIPIELIMSIGRSRERVPLPPIIEALIMETVLEMLREAGLRLPSRVGQTVGIVGGIVIGQAAVDAGIVSNVMVVVVAFTAIASFIQPQQDMASAIRLLRFPFMLAAYLLGSIGIVCGMMILAAHLVTLRSLRTPFGSPYAPIHTSEWKDTILRFPRWLLQKRPSSLRPKQQVRQQAPQRFKSGHPEGDT
jgi:spore germination protein